MAQYKSELPRVSAKACPGLPSLSPCILTTKLSPIAIFPVSLLVNSEYFLDLTWFLITNYEYRVNTIITLR